MKWFKLRPDELTPEEAEEDAIIYSNDDGCPYRIKCRNGMFYVVHGGTPIGEFPNLSIAQEYAKQLTAENGAATNDHHWLDDIPEYQKELIDDFVYNAASAYATSDERDILITLGVLFGILRVAAVEQGVSNDDLQVVLNATADVIGEYANIERAKMIAGGLN